MSGLPYPEWQDTLDTLHMWTRVIGKIQLALALPVRWSRREVEPG